MIWKNFPSKRGESMRYLICVLILALLAVPVPPSSRGDGAVPVDAFIEKAGVEADDALRARISEFLEARALTARIVDMMDPALARRYAERLAEGLPIGYPELMAGEGAAVPEDLDGIRLLAVVHPNGAGVQSLLVDFEHKMLYYDEDRDVTADVCMAAHAVPLTDEAAARFKDILRGAGLDSWDADYPGDASAGVNALALGFDGGTARFTVAAVSQAPDKVLDVFWALLKAGSDHSDP